MALVAAGAGAFRNAQRMAETGSWVTHTYQVLGLMEAVLASLQEIGAAQRGFVATGMEEFLSPVATAREALTRDLGEIRRLTADNPEQIQRLAALQPLIAERLAHAAESERLRRERGLQAASAFVAAGEGERLVTGIRERVREMERLEEELLARRRENAAASARNSFIALALAGAISVVVVAALFVTLHRLNAGLEARVQQRTEELSRANRSLRVLAESNRALVQASSERDLLEQACRIAVEEGGYGMAWVGYAEHDEPKTVRPVAHAGAEAGYLQDLNVTWGDTERGRGPTGTAIRTATPMVSRSVETDPRFAVWRAEALQRGYGSSCALPLVIEGRVVGALSIYAAEPDAFAPAEVVMLTELAADLSMGITTLRGREERQLIDEASRLSEARYRGVLDSMREGFQIIGSDWRYVYLNDVAAAHGRRRKEDLLGRTMMECYPGIETTAMFGLLRECMETRSPRSMENEFTYPDGSTGWFALSIEPAPEGIFVVSLDITERKRAEDALRQLNAELDQRVIERTEQLREMNKELESFCHSVSHDLRAPVRAMDGFARILEEDHGGRLDAEGRRLLGVVRGNAQRMGRLIDDLLAFSRAGRQDLRREPVDMSALAEAAISDVLGDAAQRDRVEVRLGSLPAAEGDPAMIRQVWINLVSNAVKFAGTRKRPIVDIEGTREANRLVYRVRDNGVGFDMAHVGKLFGVFERLHSAQEFDGTGVGLALVKRIVTRHGGDAWGEGRVGHGATFGFWLPCSGGKG